MVHACGMTMDSPNKSRRNHGVFQILKSVADRMTGAIFILVREQSFLWGVNQIPLPPYKECN